MVAHTRIRASGVAQMRVVCHELAEYLSRQSFLRAQESERLGFFEVHVFLLS
jgi:hypothetical protein